MNCEKQVPLQIQVTVKIPVSKGNNFILFLQKQLNKVLHKHLSAETLGSNPQLSWKAIMKDSWSKLLLLM